MIRKIITKITDKKLIIAILIVISIFITGLQIIAMSQDKNERIVPEPITNTSPRPHVLEDYKPAEGNAATALRLLPEQALCWTFEKEEIVAVVAVSKQPISKEMGNKLKEIAQVKIIAYFDQRMEDRDLMQFVMIEGEESKILEILSLRPSYNIELIKSAKR